MARKIANINREGRSRNLWWITAAVVAFIILCGGGITLFRMYSATRPQPLPEVHTFAFSTSTPAAVTTISPSFPPPVILIFPLLGVDRIIENFVNGTMSLDYVGGVLAPNESAFIASNWALSWNIIYRVYGNGSIMYNDRNFNFTLSPSVVEMTCQTLGSGEAAFETIAVAAGAFRSLRVICRGDGQVNAVVNGSQVTGSISAQGTQWFAPRVGLLRLQGDFVNLNVFGLSIPLNSSGHAGTLELTSYVVGP
ncbi:MAG: hypothetical protein FJZ87_03970 [Chloroflexi bacterium]|nr:hypothetical protein [Chloroflexota bacterium]